MEFISVIIPAFNAERWLESTLKSVSEAIDSECEVIIVNDGSVDDTGVIARRFMDADPRFSLVEIEHVGPCAARRAGFMESQGDYIVFVDSDDLLPKNAISEQRHLLDEYAGQEDSNPDTHTVGRPKIIVGNTVARTGDVDKLLINGQTRALTGMEYAREILTRSLPGFLPGHFYARELVEAIDWDDSPEITHQENYYLLLSFAMKLNEWGPDKRHVLVAPSSVCYYYMRRAGSQSALMALTLKGLERVWNHINKLGLPEPELTLWGLEVIYRVFVERGIPFPTSYSVAADIRRRAKALGDSLSEENNKKVESLGSEKKRRHIARELAATAGLTSLRPHLSIVIICHHNVAKVERTVASIFAMGFRNLEAILVDYDNSHTESLQLSNICISYARVRVVQADKDKHIYYAAVKGLYAAEGLSVTFARPGDLCCANGLYDAVTRIDYGADAVMPNFRSFHPMTRIRGKISTYADLRSTEKGRNAAHTMADATEDVHNAILELLDNPAAVKPLMIYGIVWRTDFLKNQELSLEQFTKFPAHSLSHAFLRQVMSQHIRVVTQDRTSEPTFEFANDSFLKRTFQRILPGHKDDTFTPTSYK